MEEINKKIKRLTSDGAWGIILDDESTINLADGPNGLRRVIEEKDGYQTAYPSFAYPTLSLLGNTWNNDLVYKIGQGIADDCKKNDISVILGPGVNIKRSPLCGRNFEYFSEDPVLSGNLGFSYINGVQSKGVGTSLKHFAGNNREYDRFFQSSEIDERTLREIYLKPFEIALKANPWTIMCAYNPVNGVLSSENPYLLKEILRDTFHYDGLVISDWGSVRNRAKSLHAGIDVAFPFNPYFYGQLEEALNKNYISTSEIDSSIKNIDRLIKKAAKGKELESNISDDEKNQLIKDAALEGIVLLKNNGVLPLKQNQNILLVGEFLNNPPLGGGGSSNVTPNIKVESLYNCLTKLDSSNRYSYEQGYMLRYGLVTPFGYKVSLEKAYRSDVVIVGVGDTVLEEKEETDREKIKMCQAFEDYINKVCEYNQNVIVVIYSGSAVDVSNFKDKVAAIVYAGYGGQMINNALSEILLGNVSPSGRLSETWPLALEDTPTNKEIGNSFNEVYYERTLVGYRYYDAKKKDVAFPFGYGLSYGNFVYKNLSVKLLNDYCYQVEFEIFNDSMVDAFEVAQLYIKQVCPSVNRAYKELKKYSKVFIKSKETKKVTFVLNKEDFAYYSVIVHDFYCENGDYEVLIGKNVNDIVLKDVININSDAFELFSRC